VKQSVELPAILSLGSNLGDRTALLEQAISDIARVPGVRVMKTSTFHETAALKPDGVDETAPAYLNAAVAIRTVLLPEQLLARLAEIETAHGRVRTERWGDRTLDIDIIAMGPLRVNTDTLTLPHPRAFERDFVLAPWLEIEPDATLAGHGRVADLLAAIGARP
jgi:2-amino-4-hydroxy-6-hydroxymethyldihydropteridine diphosphokinase